LHQEQIFIAPALDMTPPSDTWNPDLAGDYNRIAESYTEAYGDELDRKPFDRELLDRFARSVHGLVCDLGCGPGHVTRYLHSQGVNATGIDLSPHMIDIARRRHPVGRYAIGDMRRLDAAEGSVGAILSLYALIHLRRDAVVPALEELYRVLMPGGRLLLACHRGQGEVHATERFGQRVLLDATLFEPEELARYVSDAGFIVNETLIRQPYDFEYQAEKIYILATKAST
jgi:SAM-dependent methyltransferase